LQMITAAQNQTPWHKSFAIPSRDARRLDRSWHRQPFFLSQ
jgi:hypothetical protein